MSVVRSRRKRLSIAGPALAAAAAAAAAAASACSVPAVTFTPLGDTNPDAAPPDADAPADGPGSALVPSSCRALHADAPALPSGTYEIDPDGAGGAPPVLVTCDMTTDGGGWTIVFVAPNPNLAALPLDYTAGTPRLLADAELALLAFRDAALDAAPSHARFPFPAPWRTQPPFNADGESVTVPVSIDGQAPVASELRYGKYTFSTRCEHAWSQAALWGRICVVGRPAPFYAGFATTSADHCSSSLDAFSSVLCSDARRFSIAVR